MVIRRYTRLVECVIPGLIPHSLTSAILHKNFLSVKLYLYFFFQLAVFLLCPSSRKEQFTPSAGYSHKLRWPL